MLEKNFNDVVDDKEAYIKEEEDKEADNISINSIVSDQPEFDSDTEIPKDQTGQEDKIILNHVVKRIIIPGTGCDKPAKYDFLHIKYKCYFKEDNSKIIEENELKEYMFKIRLPLGITKAIKCMRRGEQSIVKLEPKYGFKKVEFEDLDRFCETEKIYRDKDNKDDNYIKNLFEKMKKNTIMYEIELINYVKMFDLTGNKNLMKRITIEGIGVDKPYIDNDVIINFKLVLNGETIIEINNLSSKLNEDVFTHAECVIIKSMKKKEKCIVEIRKEFLKENLLNCNKEKNILYKNLKQKNVIDNILDNEDNSYKRYQYEMELIKFKNNIHTLYYKDKEYTKEILLKGIGNSSPFRDALIMMPCSIKINNNIIYSDFADKGYKNENDFFEEIKKIKKSIKNIPSYEKNAQFLVEDEITKLGWNFNIYDILMFNYPNVFRKEVLQGLKPLSIFKLSFTIDNNNITELQQNYFLFKDKDINFFKNELLKYKSKDNINNIEFIGCLLNFEDYTNVFNNNLITNKAEKILEYKNISNEYYMNGFLNKAKKINKRLTEDYLRYISLGVSNKEKIAFNKKVVKNPNYISNEKDKIVNDEENKFDDNIKDITLSKFYDVSIDEHMKKIFKNLIVILYKLNLKDECSKYCNIFLRLYINDEKIYYFLYIINKDRGNYNMCETILEKIIEVYHNSEKCDEYKKELENIKNKINQHKNDHNNYLKKMMKSISS